MSVSLLTRMICHSRAILPSSKCRHGYKIFDDMLLVRMSLFQLKEHLLLKAPLYTAILHHEQRCYYAAVASKGIPDGLPADTFDMPKS